MFKFLNTISVAMTINGFLKCSSIEGNNFWSVKYFLCTMNGGHHSKILHHKKVKKKLKSKGKKKEDDDLVKGYLYPIHFVDDTKAAFNLLDLMIGTPVMMVDRANFVQHIFEFVELDISYKELYNRLEIVDVDELMILWDPMQKFGASYNVVIHPDKMNSLKKFYGLQVKTKLKEDDIVEESVSKLEASMNNSISKWVSLGSSLDVDPMVILEERKPTKIRMQTEVKNCNQAYIWTDKREICCSYESKPETTNVGEGKRFRDQSLQFQAKVELSSVSNQAGYVPKRNEATQTCYQILTEEEIEMHLRHPDLPRFLHKVLPEFEKILIENAQWDIFKDDWNDKIDENQ